MSRALRNGMPRMFSNHKGARGHWFREHYRALEQRLGTFDSVCREYAGAVAALWCEFRSDTLALEAAEKARDEGQGRRPSAQMIARLKKRAALSWGSYDAALRRLEELMAKRTRTVTFADTVRRQP
jgi:hypothetical protein